MNILLIVLGILLGVIALLGIVIGLLFLNTLLQFRLTSKRNQAKLGPTAPLLQVDGQQFRDLNKNGKLDIYEDRRRPIAERVEDLLQQMTLEEKVGLMFQPMIGCTPDGDLQERKPEFATVHPTSELVVGRHIRHFNLTSAVSPRAMARWYNRLQKMAERTRLGIPVTISSDPRHSPQQNIGAAIKTRSYSQWPDPVGLAATRDPDLVREFGDIARQEYVATGIRAALHPMADLATEPRWARISGTFGEDAELAAQMTIAYIQGFQGAQLGPESVACMLKHFPGGGPQKDGLDAHFSYGKEQAYPGNNFAYHLIPFERAFAETEVTQIMPYYGIPLDQTSENVGMAFNKDIITGLLREEYGFEGIVCSDWMICESIKLFGLFQVMAPTAWGVEHLTPMARYQKALEAGVDQFGGQFQTHRILDLVTAGQISETRIDESARRILRLKFELGLFDDPYVDEARAETICGQAAFRAKGDLAQRKSIVLLKNGADGAAPVLPLRGRPKVYIEALDAACVTQYADVVATPEEADFALLHLRTPWRPMGKGFLERIFHQGDLDFEETEKARILHILNTVPTIVAIYLDRAAVIPEITEHCAALLAEFNVADNALLDVIFGNFDPCGKLPFGLPCSMETVRAQKEDVPYDCQNPLFHFGEGMGYEKEVVNAAS